MTGARPRAPFAVSGPRVPPETVASVARSHELVVQVVASSRAARERVHVGLKQLRREAREFDREGVRLAKLLLRDPKRGRPFCGARCRDGHPCQRKSTPQRERCRQHGGLSTGPRTAAGKARIAAAQRERWARWRGAGEATGAPPVVEGT